MTFLMKVFRIVFRLSSLVILSISGLVLMGIYSNREKNSPINQKQKEIRQWWLKKVVEIVGIKLTTIGNKPKATDSALWVANHVSWLDIPIIGSEGVSFLSKAEIRKWPVIGWLGEKGGTVFIQRGGKNASQQASTKIADSILLGDSVLVFPEATTTNGKDVKRFHARIFAPVIDRELAVQPVAIRYLDENGNHHPSIEWSDESFISNVMKILAETNIHVEVHFLEPLVNHGLSERKKIADISYNLIRGVVKQSDNLR